LRLIFIACWTFTIIGCGGGGDKDSPSPAQPAQPSGIGAAGGTVSHASGASVTVPAGALSQNVAIAVAQSNTGAPALPAGLTPIGSMFAFTPHGTTFAVPVTVTLPFDPTAVPSGRTPALYKTNAQNAWERVSAATFGATLVTASITSFSHAQVVIEPLLSTLPIRNWSFQELLGDEHQRQTLAKGTQIEGIVFEQFDLGPTEHDEPLVLDDGTTAPNDGVSTNRIFSSADGVTYWVSADSPSGDTGFGSDRRVGSNSEIEQIQTFIKQTSNASYSFTVTSIVLDAVDENGVLNRICPPKHGSELSCSAMHGLVFLQVDATTNEPDPATGQRNSFYSLGGGVTLDGWAEKWDGDAYSVGMSPLWGPEDFDLVETDARGPKGHARYTLKESKRFTIDLSSVDIGEAFTVRTIALAETWDHIAGPPSEFPTSVTAYFRDPAQIGGTSIVTSGLQQIAPVVLPPPDLRVTEPAACTSQPNPNPAAGTLQFSAAAFTTSEANGGRTSIPAIFVTRTGGTTGLITATFSTSDGSAIADTDYRSLSQTITFQDGDSQRRAVIVQPIDDVVGGEPDKVVNLTLSQPGGCAALGAQTTAVLNIRDNDPAPPAPSGLDASFDGDGKVTTAFGGDDTAMALQPDGKIVLVGGSTSDFVLARYNADGSLDSTFDGDGQVTTSILSGITEESARGVAIQPDGKIVVAGYTGVFGRPGRPTEDRFDFAIVRYNANGSLDPSFGTGGIVNTGVIGRAFAVALQSDGKIVVAGDAPLTQDFRIARYNSDGTLDASFDADGQVTTDVEDGGQFARNILVQANGALWVTGPHTIVDDFSSNQHTALARFTSTGALDTSFSGDGRLLLTNTRVGEDAILQPDGKIVLTGNSGTAPATQFATMRLNADGSIDTNFGTAGIVSTPITQLGDGALALALQSDGKIVVAGSSSRTTNSNFAVVRYTSAGALDATFLGDGSTTVDFFGFSDRAETVAIQPNGRIVLGGRATNNVDGYGLVRIVP
jgi:uncharacterized delta-60 repeat protein